MEYQVWKKTEYSEDYTKVDCGDLGAVKRELEQALKGGKEAILTQIIPYELTLKIGEPGGETLKPKKKSSKAEVEPKEEENVEAEKSEAEPDQSPGD